MIRCRRATVIEVPSGRWSSTSKLGHKTYKTGLTTLTNRLRKGDEAASSAIVASRGLFESRQTAAVQQTVNPRPHRLVATRPARRAEVRPDGTVIDGHHRLKILYDRGIDMDALP